MGQFLGIKKLIFPFTVHLFQEALESELNEPNEREISLQKELQVLQEASRGQERDLLTLNSVLQCNQDVINVRQTLGFGQTNTWVLTEDHLNYVFIQKVNLSSFGFSICK